MKLEFFVYPGVVNIYLPPESAGYGRKNGGYNWQLKSIAGPGMRRVMTSQINLLPAIGAQAKGGGGGGSSPRSRASRAAFTGIPASHGTPTWHNPQP